MFGLFTLPQRPVFKNHIKSLHPTQSFFSNKNRISSYNVFNCPGLSLHWDVALLCQKICPSFSVFIYIISVLYVPYLSCWPPLFVPPKETVYAPHLSLLCAHLLHFPSIPPYCLLSLSILPINYSAQPLPPTEAMSPPPLEMNDWQVCSVSNIHANNRGERKWLHFTKKIQEMTEKKKGRLK